MIYQGSKARIRKDILPFIQNCIDSNKIKYYFEPFVGGANVIPYVKCERRIGQDINKELINLLIYMKYNPKLQMFPNHITLEHYKEVREARKLSSTKYNSDYIAGIGYFASFGGRYFDGGFGRDKTGKRDIYSERLAYAKKEASLYKDIMFIHTNYENTFIPATIKSMIYCDPPYKGTKTYNGCKFDYEKFYEWLREVSKNNFVLVSEYTMPDDFVCIWSKERKVLQKSDRKEADVAVEKLFTLKDGLYEKWLLTLN